MSDRRESRESGEADDQGTTQEFDPALGAGPPTEINAGEGCVLNAQESEEVEEQERGDEEGGRGEGAGAGEAGKEATNDVKARPSARNPQDENG